MRTRYAGTFGTLLGMAIGTMATSLLVAQQPAQPAPPAGGRGSFGAPAGPCGPQGQLAADSASTTPTRSCGCWLIAIARTATMYGRSSRLTPTGRHWPSKYSVPIGANVFMMSATDYSPLK